jgi:hypothetical protein
LLRHGQTRDVQIIDVLTLDSEEYRVHTSTAGKEAIFQQIVQDPDHQPREVPRESTAPGDQ